MIDITYYLRRDGSINNQKIRHLEIPEEYDWCKSKGEYLYALKNQLTEPPRCSCGNDLKFLFYTKGYRTFCSVKCKSNDPELTKQRQESCLRTYGVISPFQKKEILDKAVQKSIQPEKMEQRKLTNLKRYGVIWFNNPSKIRQTKIEKGLQIPDTDIPDFELYRRRVRVITRGQSLTHLKDYDKRGRTDYHLDHIYSVKQGFLDNIPPYIIGDLINLRMIDHRENVGKGVRCDMTKNELLSKWIVKNLKRKRNEQ